MKSTDFFNTKLLPVFNEKIKVRKDKINEEYIIDPITHYDQFVAKGNEYIILPHYSKATNVESVLQNCGFNTIYNNKNPSEPSFLAFRESSLPDTYKHAHNTVMCIYFLQNKNEEIERFFDYYLNQGIEKIFMYYCGKLSERPNLPQRKEVVYLEWSHIFWHLPTEGSQSRVHNLQVPLYNMFAKKIGMHCNWFIFCDLDEYIKAPNDTLKTYLNKYIESNHLFTQHRWAHIKFEANEVEYEEYTCSGRGKTILKGNLIKPSDTFNVHRSLDAQTSNLLMFHHRKASNANTQREQLT